MRRRKSLFIAITSLIISSSVLAPGVATLASATTTASCSQLTKTALATDGYVNATGPIVTAYNYTKTSANAANSLGTTLDFGSKALVVACISPSDIKKLSAIAQGSAKPTMTADQYMAYMVKHSAGAMKKTKVGVVNDYLDFGSGKEDGLGSTSTAGSVRLDAWVSGNFIFLTFSAPAVQVPAKPLLALIKTTGTMF